MTDETVHSKYSIENHDPFAKFLTKTLRLTPLGYGLVILVAGVLLHAWVGWYYDVFLTLSKPPGLLQDFTALTVALVMYPVINGLYLWTTVGTTAFFQQLNKEGIFKSDNWCEGIIKESTPLFNNRKVFVVVLGLSLFLTLAQISAYLGLLPWKTIGGYIDLYPSISIVVSPFWFLFFYAMFFGIYNVGITIVVLRKMFRTKDIQLLPLHPDKCGGLRSISQYSIKIAYGIGATGLVMSAATVYEIQNGTLQNAYPVILGIVAYMMLSPILFFWPLGTARKAMQEAKDSEILMLARQFQRIYEQVKQDGGDKTNNVEKLENLKKVYQIALEFPVWPFDTRNLRRFFAIVTAPLLPAFISIIAEILQNIIL